MISLSIIISIASIAVSFFLFSFIFGFGLLELIMSFSIALFAGTITYSLFYYIKTSRLKNLERNFPEFLRYLYESLSAGISLPKAFENAARLDFGELTKEIKKVVKDMYLGVSFPQALQSMRKRLKESLYIDRALNVLISVYFGGGNAAEAIKRLQNAIVSINEIKEERKTLLRQQTMILYIMHFVFIGILIIIYKMFLPIFSTGQSMSLFGITEVQSSLDISTFKIFFFAMILVYAISNGLLIGIITENSFGEGIKQVSFLLLPSILAYYFIIYPPMVVIEPMSPLTADVGSKYSFAATLSIEGKLISNAKVICEFLDQKINTITNNKGEFECIINMPEKSGLYQLRVEINYKGKIYEKTFEIEAK